MKPYPGQGHPFRGSEPPWVYIPRARECSVETTKGGYPVRKQRIANNNFVIGRMILK